MTEPCRPRPPELPPWAPGMHEEVRRLVTAAGLRRLLPTRCWVGHPGGEEDETCIPLAAPDGAAAPHGLRVDLVERALDGLEQPAGSLAWLARSGPLLAGDDELAWWSAARAGFARHGLVPAGFCVLNRVGWLDLAGGAGRTWTRVRRRPASGTDTRDR
ncbi:hypothetical protein [Nocardioides aequoreus]|uniref:hypothetical protein n=1 Tax=Nocardioides aequoreus TaxID=397278 RepID=UPI0004C39EAE|nr:hypothetical protein [Nocardioides aequoreus]